MVRRKLRGMTASPWVSDHRGPLTVTDDFAVLDDPVEQGAFTRAAEGVGEGALNESTLVVQGMYCAACADAVEGALLGRQGVAGARVHAATRRLVLRWDPARTTLSALARSVGDTGYRLLPLQQALGIDEGLRQTRQALWRLFVAGLCMMQVMMYAWPAYVTEPGDIPADIEQLLRWASWILSVPVLVFACGPFFRNAWADVRRRRVGMDTPVTLGILITFIASTGATFDPTGPWGHEVWFDSLTMFVFFLLGGRYLEARARERSAGALDQLMNRLPPACARERADGSVETVSARRLTEGDVVRVPAGDAFPADGTLLDGVATVDEALLTGESHPRTRRTGESLVAGSINLGGLVRLRVSRVGEQTRFAQIVRLMERAATDQPRLAQLADRIAGPFLIAVVIAAAIAAVWWWPIDHSRSLAVAVAVLIVTCPCALSLATPAAMLSAAGAMARRGVLVRRLQAFEALSGVDTVVFDKTGTLTEDRLDVDRVLTRPGVSREQALAWAAALAQGSLHPVSRAIVAAAGADKALPGWASAGEVAGQGVAATDDRGVPWRLGSAAFAQIDPATADALPADAPRVFLSDGTGWVASFGLVETLREDARDAVQALHAAGLHTMLLTGDRPAAAARVASRLGIARVQAEATPEDKLRVIAQLQASGHRVAMVGDGLNDGPVLARADTAFAIGRAAPLTQARADWVVQSGALMEVVQTWRLSRQTLRVVRQNLIWAAVYNAVGVPLAIAGYMPPWLAGLGMAASSLLVVGNAMRLSQPLSPDEANAAAPSPRPAAQT